MYNYYGKLIFEGEYKDNLKWNGIGYNDNKYLYTINNGNGKGKEYNDDGELIFEGEYKEGKRNGKGKE